SCASNIASIDTWRDDFCEPAVAPADKRATPREPHWRGELLRARSRHPSASPELRPPLASSTRPIFMRWTWRIFQLRDRCHAIDAPIISVTRPAHLPEPKYIWWGIVCPGSMANIYSFRRDIGGQRSKTRNTVEWIKYV